LLLTLQGTPWLVWNYTKIMKSICLGVVS
jgi:hypothetical protein